MTTSLSPPESFHTRIFNDLKIILTDSKNQKKKLKDLKKEYNFNEKELERLKKENAELSKENVELNKKLAEMMIPAPTPSFNPMFSMMSPYFNQFTTPYGMNPLISPSASAAAAATTASAEPFPKKVKRASKVTKPKSTAIYSLPEFLDIGDPEMINWNRIGYLGDEVRDYLRTKGIHNAAQLIEAVKKEVLKFHQITKPNSRDLSYEETYEWRDIEFGELYLWRDFKKSFNAQLRFGNDYIMKWLQNQFP